MIRPLLTVVVLMSCVGAVPAVDCSTNGVDLNILAGTVKDAVTGDFITVLNAGHLSLSRSGSPCTNLPTAVGGGTFTYDNLLFGGYTFNFGVSIPGYDPPATPIPPITFVAKLEVSVQDIVLTRNSLLTEVSSSAASLFEDEQITITARLDNVFPLADTTLPVTISGPASAAVVAPSSVTIGANLLTAQFVVSIDPAALATGGQGDRVFQVDVGAPSNGIGGLVSSSDITLKDLRRVIELTVPGFTGAAQSARATDDFEADTAILGMPEPNVDTQIDLVPAAVD
ncbi:MAG: hypothetical protein PF961_13765 [Planctomycetota bacterium]|jgi:hypothetical protein|nr:hypothetical protein [Planctomycetota bacterium]